MLVQWFRTRFERRTPSGELISDVVAQFKTMLVRRYNWSVEKAHKYSHPELKRHLLDGKSVEEAYFSIFNVEQDLLGSEIIL